MRVVIVEPEKEARIAEIEGSLQDFYDIIGCDCIDSINLGDFRLIIDDEGKLNGSKPNRALRHDGEIVDIVMGTFVVVGNNIPEFRSLTDEEIRRVMELFGQPENLEEEIFQTFLKSGMLEIILKNFFEIN